MKRSPNSIPHFLWLAMVAFNSCSLGPDYTSPVPDAPAAWGEAVSGASGKKSPAFPTAWGDRQLTALLAKADSANRDLARAKANLQAAVARRDEARASLFPSIGADAALTRQRQSETGALADLPIPTQQTLYSTGMSVAWELDLFGYNRKRVEASNARLAATAEDLASTRLAILSETALAYVEWAALAESIAQAEERIALQRQTRELVGARLQCGLANSLEDRSASRELRLAESELPELKASLAAAQYRLAVLTGTPPEQFRNTYRAPTGLPENPSRRLPNTLPAEVLRARPDVRAAERQLAAAYADLGVAEADFYPRLRLTGGLGSESADAGDLYATASRTWLIRPTVHLPVFEGGRLRAQRAGAEANRSAAQSAYEQSVLRALSEVETILSDHRASVQSEATLKSAVADARAAERHASHLHQTGVGTLESLLDASRQRSLTEVLHTRTRAATLSHTIRYHKATAIGLR